MAAAVLHDLITAPEVGLLVGSAGGVRWRPVRLSRHGAALLQVVCAQRGPVADQPQVAERVDEAALPVNAPGRLVVTDLVDTAVGASGHGAVDEAVRVLDEHLDPDRPRAKGGRCVPTVALGFAEEERGTGDGQPHDA